MGILPKRFKWIKQHDSKQCGAACLSMICHHYGVKHTQEYLNRLCNVTVEGVSMYSLGIGANSIGLETETLSLSTDELKSITLPCILHWNQRHFVVLTSISDNGDKFKVADPSKGIVKYEREEFEGSWLCLMEDNPNGIAMQLRPTDDFISPIMMVEIIVKNRSALS